jgi:SAM-dependent methyltransferase
MMTLTRTQIRDYIFSMADDGDRTAFQYKCFKPSIIQTFNEVLDEYNLVDYLGQVRTSPKRKDKVRILDVGCGEGLHLYDLAEIIEKRGMLGGAEFYGFDIAEKAFVQAEAHKYQTMPPRTYLNFYIHDVRQPLEQCEALLMDAEKPLDFNFIYALHLLNQTTDARKVLTELYRRLRPGGVLYLRNLVEVMDGEDGVISPHPVMTPYIEAVLEFMNGLNDGLNVAGLVGEWLEELGATKIQINKEHYPMGGQTETGLNLLRNLFTGIRNSAPVMLAAGKFKQADYTNMVNTLFKEMGPQMQGRVTYISVTASKA